MGAGASANRSQSAVRRAFSCCGERKDLELTNLELTTFRFLADFVKYLLRYLVRHQYTIYSMNILTEFVHIKRNCRPLIKPNC